VIDLSAVVVIADIAREQAARIGDQTAITFEGRATTFSEVDRHASRIANRLIADGAPPGERVAYISKNSDMFHAFMFGAAKARAALTPINFRLAAPEISYILDDSGSRFLFVGPEFAEMAEKASESCAKPPKLISLGFERPGFLPFASWLDGASDEDPRLAAELDDDFIQLYTSGTTGHPKGVQLTNRNYMTLLGLAEGLKGLDYLSGETSLGAMPFFHVAGVNIAIIAMARGARTLPVKDLLPSVVLDLIQRERVNHAFLAPAIIMMLMNAPEIATIDLSSMRTVSYGASPIAEDLLVRAKARFGCDFVQFYGMTETTGAGTFLPAEAHDPKFGKLRSCGIPAPAIDLQIVDADGREVGVGEVGEIVVRSEAVMKGYWNQPEPTAHALRGGWMHTGDAAYRDADGYVYIYDRLKDMIVTGGENVYPAEVENAIFGHPDLADVAVIGVPDERWGEAVKAIVVSRPGAPRDPASVIAWARERIANFKAPKSVDYIDAIPRNVAGKVLRRELRKPYWEGRDRMIS
jgi:acyl-CoA synthetase (AMP-forming)/AMP-acid ligase II